MDSRVPQFLEIPIREVPYRYLPISDSWFSLFLYVKEKIGPLVDPAGIVTVLYAVLYIYGEQDISDYTSLFLISFFVGLLTFSRSSSFSKLGINGYAGKTIQVLFSWAAFTVVIGAVIYYTADTFNYNNNVIIAWLVATPVVGVALRAMTTFLTRVVLANFSATRNAVLIGNSKTAHILACRLSRNRIFNINVSGFFDDRTHDREDICSFCPKTECNFTLGTKLGSIADASEYIVNNKVSVVYITLPLTHNDRIKSILSELQDTQASIYFIPDLFSIELVHPSSSTIDGIPVLGVNESPFTGMNYPVKRISDIVLSSILITLLLPLFALISIAIKLTSRNSVIFKQRRYGIDGKEFVIYKFRTMDVDEDGTTVNQATRDDIRVTRLGKILRKYSLDELPQLFNVLQGRMSLVGPRPHAITHNEQYRKNIKKYMRRHIIKPGMTGLAQINGYRGETLTSHSMQGRLYYDLVYISKWSIALDFYILLKTMRVVMNDSNAY